MHPLNPLTVVIVYQIISVHIRFSGISLFLGDSGELPAVCVGADVYKHLRLVNYAVGWTVGHCLMVCGVLCCWLASGARASAWSGMVACSDRIRQAEC